MNASNAVRQLLDLCGRVYAKGFVSGSGGNISLRDGDGILITPTGRNIGLLEPEDVVRMRLDGTVVSGGAPSQEHLMHRLCYARDDVACVAHVHSVHACAVSCLDPDPSCAMPAYTPGYAVRTGKLPVVPYFRPGSQELATAAADVITGRGGAPRRNSVLLANHGLLCVGASLEKAMNLAEEIEENARMFLLLGGGGKGLTEAQQADLAGKY